MPERRLADDCGTLKICWSDFQESRRHLALSLCLLILKAALHSSGDECGIETSLAVSLLIRQKDFAIPVPPCPPARRNRAGTDLPLVALLEQKSTPQIIRASHKWKNRLAEGLLRDATQRHELIVNTVSEVCRDLEERCEDLERPLREEQAKLSRARAHIDESDLRIAALEVELSERELFIDGLEAEKQRLESQVSSTAQRVQELEHLLQQAADETLDTKVAASDGIKEMELNHLAAVSVKDERISELEQEIQRMEQELRRLRDEVEATAEEKFEAQGDLIVIQKKLAESSTKLEQEKAISILKHTEIDNLNRLNEVLRTNVEALNHDVSPSPNVKCNRLC
jgi:chromosome segregation ATPase